MIKQARKLIEEIAELNEKDICCVISSEDYDSDKSYRDFELDVVETINSKSSPFNDRYVLFGSSQIWSGTNSVKPMAYDLDMFMDSLSDDYDIIKYTIYNDGSFEFTGIHHDGTNYYKMIPLNKFDCDLTYHLAKNLYDSYDDFLYNLFEFMKEDLTVECENCDDDENMICKYLNEVHNDYFQKCNFTSEELEKLDDQLQENIDIQRNIKEFFIAESYNFWRY